MKSMRLGDVRELLDSAAFAAWWTRWQEVSSALHDARLRHDELVAQSELMARRSDGAKRRATARRTRRNAERLLGEAEERRVRARQLAADADAARRELHDAQGRLDALRAEARDRFDCVPGDAFLYFQQADDPRSAFAISLADAPANGAGVSVKALGIYVAGRQRGVTFLAPATSSK